MSRNSGEDKDRIPKKKRALAKKAARALRGGVPEPKPQIQAEESEIPSPLIDGGLAGNQSQQSELDENDDPLARPSTADSVKPEQAVDEDIPAGRGAKAEPMKPIKLPNDDYGPHAGLGD